jgi:hypothetical protein
MLHAGKTASLTNTVRRSEKVPVNIKSMERINYIFSRKCKLIIGENDEVVSNEWRKLFEKI